MSEPTTPRVRPAERYGDVRPGPRRAALRVGILLLVAAVLLGVLGWIAWHWAFPPARWGLTGYTVRGTNSVEAQFWVRRDPSTRVTCSVLARNIDHEVVGRREVEIPEGPPSQQSVTATLRTSDRPVNAELAGCSPAQ